MSMEPQAVSVGRIVHYTGLGDPDQNGEYPFVVWAALVTGINDDGTVSLHVFNRTSQFDLNSVERTTEPAGSRAAMHRWCWPARA